MSNEDLDDDTDDEDMMFLHIQSLAKIKDVNIYSVVCIWWYASNYHVGMFELCVGEGRIARVAVKGGCIPGWNLYSKTYCDLGDLQVRTALKTIFGHVYESVTIFTTDTQNHMSSIKSQLDKTSLHEGNQPPTGFATHQK